jgi:TldD protein
MDEFFDLCEMLTRSGADFGDIYAGKSLSHSVEYENGRLEETKTSKNSGTGVRLLFKDATVYTYLPGTLVKGASEAVLECCARYNGPGASFAKNGLASAKDLVPGDPGIEMVDRERLEEVDRHLRGKSSLVQQVSLRFGTVDSGITILSSEGSIVRKRRQATRFSVQVVVEEKGSLFTGYEVRAFSVDAKGFLEKGDLVETGEKALRRALLQSSAVLCPAGVMPVILSGRAGGTMIHEACGHGLEADILEKDYSVYRGKKGQTVASELVTLVDDATIPGLYGSYTFDDEGTPAQRTILIENGVLCNLLTDVETAKNQGLPRSGNGRRASWSAPPMPRMSNTFIMGGKQDPEEIVGSMKEGLLVYKMGGGEVHPTTGDFVFHVEEGYLVKDGKKGKAVKNAILTGNGPEVLKLISAVGNDLHFESGVCGKSGQHVPVTDGQPTILVERLTVGGSDTADEHPRNFS